MRVLVTGATGYIGGRLVPWLIEAGHDVRCLARNPSKLDQHPWREAVEVVAGDVLDADTLGPALSGCDGAYYLVHSMDGGASRFGERDRRAASNFREASDAAGVRRIVYLGGLGTGDDLSEHLASRQEVGALLAAGSTPVTELRAAIVIGSGSVSFEMLRYLTEVLPAMVTPRWVRSRCQPIAVRDVLTILARAIDDEGPEDHIREIGGPDLLTYEQMMRIYAEVAGLPRRWIVPVPVLSPRLSSHWVGLVTPLPTGVAKPLVESLRIEVVVSDNSYAEEVAGPLTPYRTAVGEALQRSRNSEVETRWSDSAAVPAQPLPSDPAWAGGTVKTDHRSMTANAGIGDVFWAFARLGGAVGYYSMDWAWAVRGFADKLVGGVGLRRGRRHPEDLRPGEALDFWRVSRLEQGVALELYAEMKLPGEAWLSFRAVDEDDTTRLEQTAYFVPRGLLGRLYWLVLAPFHTPVFHRMARGIVAAAESRAVSSEPPGSSGPSGRAPGPR